MCSGQDAALPTACMCSGQDARTRPCPLGIMHRGGCAHETRDGSSTHLDMCW